MLVPKVDDLQSRGSNRQGLLHEGLQEDTDPHEPPDAQPYSLAHIIADTLTHSATHSPTHPSPDSQPHRSSNYQTTYTGYSTSNHRSPFNTAPNSSSAPYTDRCGKPMSVPCMP